MTRKKMIGNAVFLIVVFALTIYGVFHGEDFGEMMAAIQKADIRWLIPGVVLVMFFIWGESIIIWYMMKSFRIFLNVAGETDLFFIFIRWIFFQLHYTVCHGRPAYADLLYE